MEVPKLNFEEDIISIDGEEVVVHSRKVGKNKMTLKEIQRDLFGTYFNLPQEQLRAKLAIANTIGGLAKIELEAKISIRSNSTRMHDVFGINAENRGRKKNKGD